jgi:hypothetical protein
MTPFEKDMLKIQSGFIPAQLQREPYTQLTMPPYEREARKILAQKGLLLPQLPYKQLCNLMGLYQSGMMSEYNAEELSAEGCITMLAMCGIFPESVTRVPVQRVSAMRRLGEKLLKWRKT